MSPPNPCRCLRPPIATKSASASAPLNAGHVSRALLPFERPSQRSRSVALPEGTGGSETRGRTHQRRARRPITRQKQQLIEPVTEISGYNLFFLLYLPARG